MLKYVLEDNNISIVLNKKEIFVGTVEELTDKKILNSKIKHVYTDDCTPGKHGSCLVIGIKKL